MRRPDSLQAVAAARAAAPETPLAKPLCEFLDRFYEPQADHAAMLRDPPFSVIAREEAAYLAAVAEHLSLLYRLPAPAWANAPEHFLDRAFWPEPAGRAGKAIQLAESPLAFRRRFIFTEGQPLRRKHGPKPVAA